MQRSLVKKITHLIVLFSLFFIVANAQQTNEIKTGKFTISGIVLDSLSKETLEYATISLHNDVTQKVVAGMITSKKGNFKLENIKAGNYTLLIESIGYLPLQRKLTLSENAAEAFVVENVLLTKKTKELQTVTVNSTRQVIENKLDKIVFNVEKDLTTQGGMATDVLKKIPQVSVDINGNVELLGNPSIRFLINGMPSGIFGNSPADALQSIPASQIQSIEVITSPSAKYDAAGTGGIINIILKKTKLEGINGNVNMSLGTRLENATANLSWKKDNIGLNAYFSGNMQLTAATPYSMNRLAQNNGNGSTRFLQESQSEFDRDGYKAGINMDWEISKKDNINIALDFNHFGNRTNGNFDQTFIQYNSIGTLLNTSNSLRFSDSKVSVNTIDQEVSYKRKLGKEDQVLEIFYAGSFSQNNTTYAQTQSYKTTHTNFAGANSYNPGKENEIEFGINYTVPLSKEIILETGVKTGFESILSNATVNVLNNTSGNYVVDPVQSFQSDFRRQVYAGYASIDAPLFSIFELKTGLRFEHTDNEAIYSNASKTAIPSYDNLAPSIILGYKINENQSLKFAYSYRIERPDFRDLNSFYNLSDPHNITTGNPNLQTEIGHNYELTYARKFDNGANINVLFYVQDNSPDIKPYVRFYQNLKIGDSTYADVTLTTRANIAAEVKTGVNISLSLPIAKKLNIRSNLFMFNRRLDNPADSPSVINAFGYRINLNATYQFSPTLAAEIFGNYNAGLVWQGRQPANYAYNFAIRKQFKNNKGSIGFVAVNPFNEFIKQENIQEVKNIYSTILRQVPYRSFGISFTYKFGKVKFSKPKEGDNFLYTPPNEN